MINCDCFILYFILFIIFCIIKNNERTIRKTWDEFRAAIYSVTNTNDNIKQAKNRTFLKVYNDLFHDNFGIEHSTIKLTDLDGTQVGRGCVLKKDEAPDYERFIPKKESVHRELNGCILPLEMKRLYFNALRQNVERMLVMNLDFVILNLMMLLQI